MIKPIPGYEELYSVTDSGEIISDRTGKSMTPFDRKGYLNIGLRKDGLRKSYPVHRLIAMAFIPNTDSKPQVNHKNGDKHDNRSCNLEWVTQSENIKHAFAHGLNRTLESQREMLRESGNKKSKPVIRDDGEIYPSVRAAARAINAASAMVSDCCSGRRSVRQVKGFTFRYATDEEVRRCKELARKENRNE